MCTIKLTETQHWFLTIAIEHCVKENCFGISDTAYLEARLLPKLKEERVLLDETHVYYITRCINFCLLQLNNYPNMSLEALGNDAKSLTLYMLKEEFDKAAENIKHNLGLSRCEILIEETANVT